MELCEEESVSNNGGIALRQFELSIHDSALKFATKLSSDMTIPRSTVFQIIEDIRTYVLPAFTEGIKNVILPKVQNTDIDQVAAFVQLCDSTFCYVDTEYKLDSSLKEKDLIDSIKKFPIGVMKANIAVER